ncbi:tRNA (adenosine(37)-N6)-threonylcarbamoyltransferase complex dimerization subunit type 1 TsaB [Sediminibacillus massiliensis]|uniref:tRNA (adenosine(37)-N6)-threonylcarbamoyltransferase complex dimerization subunit type 1 TsaB n=1 Tax=Sediminibacillus massiliensis TaxID=1926277 RepID=UPI00098881B3|nr:tRNA (adenosine(37)-N6)-threonylcarbamoyltransferase complex dimerization subunit type 1 TsaB [Sediminibacillus massiliensis]
MNILSMDTSNQTMGIAIVKNGVIVGEYTNNIKKNHSVRLMPAISKLMDETGTAPEELDKIVVAKGPGSFTGVRIGLSTAKTMGWALNIPVVGVSSLEAVALQGSFSPFSVCPFFDARRGLVYTGLYNFDSNGKAQLAAKETNILFEEWLTTLANQGQQVLFLSPDIELHRDKILETMGKLAIIPELPYHFPKPSLLALAGADKETEPVHALTPEYLRLAEAESKWLEKQREN